MCEMLPDVDGVGMLPARTASSFIKAKVGVLGSVEPWMGGKNPTPVFSETGADGDRISNRILFKNLSRTIGIFGQGMIIADSNK
jgi:hypothetical protein